MARGSQLWTSSIRERYCLDASRMRTETRRVLCWWLRFTTFKERYCRETKEFYLKRLQFLGEDSWEKPIKFQAHELGVNALSWAPLPVSDDVFGEFSPTKSEHFPKLTTGSCDKTVKIWEYRPSKCLHFSKPQMNFFFLHFEIDDANPFVEVAVFKDHTDWVRDVTFCPSIGAPYDVLVSCSEVINIKTF